MARRNPFTSEPVVTRAPLDQDIAPENLAAAAHDLYRVVLRLVRNDGRMTTEDFGAAVLALRLARNEI